MGKALYRSYRARKFDEVIGQQHITKTLKTALGSGRRSHAYLLTGPRGVGKTSIARILAHEINDLPYETEQPPIDIIEIDAASNRRIDEIRDIKEKANIAPVQAKYKVYIIDEVHMLTRESFNALLKTLEEPPKRVIFILATTELYKLPETIISRCIHFPFKPITKPDLIKHLKKIAGEEKIQIDDEAIELIADHGRGSFRDSISLLDQIQSLNAKITANDVRHALGLAPQDMINKLAGCIEKSDMKSLTGLFESLYEFGSDPVMVSRQLLEYMRGQLLENKPIIDGQTTVELMNRLLDVSSSSDPKKEFELVLIGAVVKNSGSGNQPDKTQADPPREQPAPQKPKTNEAKPPVSADTPKMTSTAGLSIWDQALEKLKNTNNTLYAVARMADSSLDKDELVLNFKFAFHKKQISSSKNLTTIEKTVNDISGQKLKIRITQTGSQETDNPAPEDKKDLKHKNISNIFGGSEVLES